MTAFAGFSEEGLALLTELGKRDRAWFQANKKRYDALVADPAKSFVDAMTESLQASISSGIVGQPKTNGSISPINNDLRFAKGKAPYKDHLLIRWWEGSKKKTAPCLWVRVSEESTGFATGRSFDAAVWRKAIDGRGDELASALKKLGKGRDLDIAGSELKRVPKPYAEDHPHADLLRHKGFFQARWPEPTPASVTKRGYVDWCVKRLERCAEVHRWLVALGR
ncbi:MAG: DUF2461 domain-containing protein [Polyangiaceae bacterium]